MKEDEKTADAMPSISVNSKRIRELERTAEGFQVRFERNYANMERVLDRQADVLNKQNEILEQLKILPEIMKGVESLYRIGVYFKTTMETFQVIDAKIDGVLARLDRGKPELEKDEGLARGRVGKKYLLNGGGPYVLGVIKRRKVKHEGVETTAGFSYTFLKTDNPGLVEDLIDLSDEEYQLERIE